MSLRETVRDVAQEIPGARSIVGRWEGKEFGPLTELGVDVLNVLVNVALAADSIVQNAKLEGVGLLVDASLAAEQGTERINSFLAAFWDAYLEAFGGDGSEDPERKAFLLKYVNPADWQAALRFIERLPHKGAPEEFLYNWLQNVVASVPEGDRVDKCRRVLYDFINGDISSFDEE